MSEDEEILAVALLIERWRGETAHVHIAEQLGTVALADDQAGIARWRAIAAAYDQLRRESRQ